MQVVSFIEPPPADVIEVSLVPATFLQLRRECAVPLPPRPKPAAEEIITFTPGYASIA